MQLILDIIIGFSILTLFFIVLSNMIKYKSMLKWQYYTSVDDKTRNEISEKIETLTPNYKTNRIILTALVIFFIIFVTSIFSSFVSYDNKVAKAKKVVSALYETNPKELQIKYDKVIKPKVSFYNSYKLNTNNINNLRDRHFKVTSSNTKVEYDVSSYNKYGNIILIYSISNPDTELLIKRLGVFKFYKNEIMDFDEYNLEPTVDYERRD